MGRYRPLCHAAPRTLLAPLAAVGPALLPSACPVHRRPLCRLRCTSRANSVCCDGRGTAGMAVDARRALAASAVLHTVLPDGGVARPVVALAYPRRARAWCGIPTCREADTRPCVLLYRPTWTAVASATAIGVLSLAAMPDWPLKWLDNLHSVLNHPPPILAPSGWVVALAVLRWRQTEARLLLAMASVPQLALFSDQLPLFLVCRTRREALFYIATSITVFLTWTMPAQMLLGSRRHARLLPPRTLPSRSSTERRCGDPTGWSAGSRLGPYGFEAINSRVAIFNT